MNEILPGLIALIVLLAGNAFFVGAEFAVISARRSQIEPLADSGDRRAKTSLWAMEHATLMLSTSQLGITFCSIIILLVSEPAVHHLLEVPLTAVNIPDSVISPIAFVVTLLLVTYLHVVVGEIIPKNMAFSIPDKAILWLAPTLVLVSRIVNPVIRIMDGLANGFLRLVGVEPKREVASTYTIDQIATIVEESTSLGSLRDESGTLTASFQFSGRKVADIMVPVEQIVKLPQSSTPADVQRSVSENGYSRYILEDEAGEPSGYVHIKDLLDFTSPEQMQKPVPNDVIRSLSETPASEDIEDTLARMRAASDHVCKVVAEDGLVVGFVFLEDILEELIGEVHDATQVGALLQTVPLE